MLDKKPRSVLLKDEEEEYLHSKGKLDNWSSTVHQYIKDDMVKDKKQTFDRKIDKVTNSLIMIFFGIVIFCLSYLIPPFEKDNFLIIIGLFICSVLCVTIGSFILVLEFVNARKRRL